MSPPIRPASAGQREVTLPLSEFDSDEIWGRWHDARGRLITGGSINGRPIETEAALEEELERLEWRQEREAGLIPLSMARDRYHSKRSVFPVFAHRDCYDLPTPTRNK